ncbi:DDE-type integrase/transposase/recombinase [Candidatus Poriferisodalis sp.]|uniref:DDE-type integrase/transposase/recombinase n=1 Tax=Candidatus Poriferisodalis sp. TaxID=3101277 RepID=UPI003C6ED539
MCAPTRAGRALAVVLDLGSRRLLGYQMSDRIDTRLAQDALDMAGASRGGRTAGIIFHSDRGSQYLAGKFTKTVTSWGMSQSVGRVGSSADNAVAESFFSTLKRELVHRHRYPDRATARRSIFELSRVIVCCSGSGFLPVQGETGAETVE